MPGMNRFTRSETSGNDRELLTAEEVQLLLGFYREHGLPDKESR